jgi:hypothetical protein
MKYRFSAREFCSGRGWIPRATDRAYPDGTPHGPHARAPRVAACIELFNRLTAWLASMVLSPTEPKLRERVLHRVIETILEARAMNDIVGAMQLRNGLSLTCIHRLRQLWATVPKKLSTAFDDLSTQLWPDNKYRYTFAALRRAAPDGACIPTISYPLMDQHFLDDSIPADLEAPPGPDEEQVY